MVLQAYESGWRVDHSDRRRPRHPQMSRRRSRRTPTDASLVPVPPRIDPSRIPAVAHLQHGVFTRAQAIADGFTRRQVDHRVRTGLWVYVVGNALAHRDAPIDAWSLACAAWLSRPDCIVLGKVAAALHGVRVELDGTVEIWTDAPGDPGPARITPRRVRLRDDEIVDVATVDGRPGRATTVARSCADTFRWTPHVVGRNALAWARSREMVTGDELVADVAAQPRTRGNPQVKRFIGYCETGAMSSDEDRAHAMLHEYGFTGWRADVPLPDDRAPVARADVYFDEARLDVEIDRPETHAHRREEDRIRDMRLRALGIATHRIQADDLARTPARVAERLREVVEARLRECARVRQRA